MTIKLHSSVESLSNALETAKSDRADLMKAVASLDADIAVLEAAIESERNAVAA